MVEDLDRVCAFLDRIELPYEIGSPADTFLPEVSIASGILTFSETATVGDILHEAGHLAVVPSQFRPLLSEDIASLAPHYDSWFAQNPDAMAFPEHPVGRAILQAGETEAIAWSYAAAIACEIDVERLFQEGFGGEGEMLQEQLEHKQYLGIHGLAAGGMTLLPKRHVSSEPAFPTMLRWLQI